jgi:hypothetical protein
MRKVPGFRDILRISIGQCKATVRLRNSVRQLFAVLGTQDNIHAFTWNELLVAPKLVS